MRSSAWMKRWRCCGNLIEHSFFLVLPQVHLWSDRFKCQNEAMNWRTLWIPLALAGLLYLSFRAFGWWGFSLVASGIVFWLLQHTSRLLMSLQRAADLPLGHVPNAVMFHAQLHNGLRLLQVLSLAGSLGRLVSAQGQQPEVFVWQDAQGSEVRCSFQEGRLLEWALSRSSESEGPLAGA